MGALGKGVPNWGFSRGSRMSWAGESLQGLSDSLGFFFPPSQEAATCSGFCAPQEAEPANLAETEPATLARMEGGRWTVDLVRLSPASLPTTSEHSLPGPLEKSGEFQGRGDGDRDRWKVAGERGKDGEETNGRKFLTGRRKG